MPATAATAPRPWTAVIPADTLTGRPTACRRAPTNDPTDTSGVIRTLSSVGTCRAVGPSHVHPRPAPTVTATTTSTVMAADSATTRQRADRSTRRPPVGHEEDDPGGGRELDGGGQGAQGDAPPQPPPVPRVIPASIRPTMRASLCPDDTKLKRASGLSTPSHSARPASLPRRRASGGSDTIMRTTPTSSRARNTRIWLTSEVPPTDAPSRLTDTKSGP